MDLLENELFGHIRGAFTNASSAQPGLIEEADGGTLFFDDVDCLALLAQAKILRFLQEKEYRRLGSTKVRRADVRIIASTNRDLKQAVREGRFRQDFYYRLNVVSFMLPPLRDRREDIVLIANHFLIKYADQYHKNVKEFSPEVLQKLMLYDWPGNVRELEHIVEQAVVLSREEAIRGADITLPQIGKTEPQESFREAKDKFIAQFERAYIKKLLLAYQGNITKAAQAARKNRRAFWELIRKHDINVRNFKPNSVEKYG